MLKVYWYGYGGHAHMAEKLRPIISELGMELITIHEHDNADIKWNKHTWIDELKKADIIVLPCNYQEQDAKSNNKLTQALALGKPVICSPLPAYVKILLNYPSAALIAYEESDWKTHLIRLRDDTEFRKYFNSVGPEIAKDYFIDNIGLKWLEEFFNTTSVDLIIPTYNNLKCLKLLLDSIKKCTSVIYKIIVVDASTNEETFQYLQTCADIISIRSEKTSFSKSVNKGLKISTSEFICILNDDIIVSDNWLSYMVETCKTTNGIVGVLSNCDFGWQNNNKIIIKDIELLPGVNTFTQIQPIVQDIYSYRSPYNDVLERPWVAFYCTLFSRELLNKVGYLDEEFVNSGEDVDFCYRATKMGYKIVQDYRAFVFHFGATSRKIAESENKEQYQLEQKETTNYLNKKYEKQMVVIYSGMSWEKWNYESLTTGIGGSEIWQIELARNLCDRYNVKVFCDCKENCKDGNIEYYKYTELTKFIEFNYIDYFISSRTTEPFDFNIRSGKNYVMIHDIWILGGNTINLHLDKVDKYITLSEWHKEFVKDYHKIPEEKLAISFNGINFARFDNKNIERNPYRLHWSSSWDRGLDNVLYLWQWLKKEIPELELHIFYGTFTWKSACERRGDKEGLKKIAELEELTKQQGIFTYGRVGQEQLAEEIQKASLLLYPSAFSETFFITGIECQYAGLPVICNKYAGVITTFGDSAIMLGDGSAWWPYTKEGREQFLLETISILKDKEKWQRLSNLSKENAKKYSWQNVANWWKDLFQS